LPPPESRPTAWLTTTAVIGRLPFAISHHKFFGGCTSGEAHACPPRGPSGCVGAGARCTWQSGGPGLAGRLWTALRAAAASPHICSIFQPQLAEASPPCARWGGGMSRSCPTRCRGRLSLPQGHRGPGFRGRPSLLLISAISSRERLAYFWNTAERWFAMFWVIHPRTQAE
jgi:hypothetical protein